MKRELIQNCQGSALYFRRSPRQDRVSVRCHRAVIGTAGALTLTITHSDDNSSYEPSQTSWSSPRSRPKAAPSPPRSWKWATS